MGLSNGTSVWSSSVLREPPHVRAALQLDQLISLALRPVPFAGQLLA